MNKKFKLAVLLAALTLFVIIQACQTGQNPKEQPKQLNVSILLDLSDRISPVKNPDNPEHKEKDLLIVKKIVEVFKQDMDRLNAIGAKGKIKVFMQPAPQIPNINALQKKLQVDLSKMTPQQKKDVYDNLENDFEDALNQIYEATIHNSAWMGSDIWRFFKNDAKSFCISKDTNYRNILVIITDGYIYDATTLEHNGNRVQNLTVSTIGKYRKFDNPTQEIEKDDFGLIVPCDDLQNLEVLVLEITPENNSQKDEIILTYCIDKWLREMGVKKSAVYKTDLPANTESRIEDFFDWEE